MSEITGIHHITAIAGDAQENLDFYTSVFGMRLVKRSVNQDDPGTYHLFYADADGHPGTDLTFFPFRFSAPGHLGVGLGVEIALAIPKGSQEYWNERLADLGANVTGTEQRRGDRAIKLTDPHGQHLALVEAPERRDFAAWDKSSVPADKQILGLHAVRVWERDMDATTSFLSQILGFQNFGEEDGWHRFGVGSGGSGEHIEIREMPNERRGAWGIGTMHHVAWRVADESVELKLRERIAKANRRPTEVIDRFWFKSVYFLEPGGVLFELATEGPGFTADEPLEHLGETLVLPPWLEPHRAQIEAALPVLSGPAKVG
ncbi:MAG TPA: ring-cleaving dioxygenase [Gemmatimonadaceae bacterium]|jgi:glyoxalase family protein|nr:ring-cleaving dioxygenase [Gemmatimonadaceae bacterium]